MNHQKIEHRFSHFQELYQNHQNYNTSAFLTAIVTKTIYSEAKFYLVSVLNAVLWIFSKL